MKLSDKQWEFLKDMSLLIQYADRKGYKLTGGELYRTSYMQKYYVEKELSETNDSQHEKRLAMDFNLFIAGVYKTDTESYRELGEFWESIRPENTWGGSWGWDGNHFERE